MRVAPQPTCRESDGRWWPVKPLGGCLAPTLLPVNGMASAGHPRPQAPIALPPNKGVHPIRGAHLACH